MDMAIRNEARPKQPVPDRSPRPPNPPPYAY